MPRNAKTPASLAATGVQQKSITRSDMVSLTLPQTADGVNQESSQRRVDIFGAMLKAMPLDNDLPVVP